MKNVHSDPSTDPSRQSDIPEKDRVAALSNLGSYISMILFENFLEHLAPPQPKFDLNATMRSLKLGSNPVLTSSNRWSNFLKAPKDSQSSEDRVFSPMPEISTKVVAAVVANSHGKLTEENRTIDFLQNPNRASTSTKRDDESRPDGYFVLKCRDKVMSKDGKREDIHWTDIALSCEYNLGDGNEDLDDVRFDPGLDIACQADFSSGRAKVSVGLATCRA